MDFESVKPTSTGASQEVDLYHELGGIDICRKLSAAFYAYVEHDLVLRPLYPPTLKGCPIETLAAFLIQFFGGPDEYAQRRWSLSLREAHLRFAIGQKEREAWLTNMFQAVDEVNIKEPMRSALRWFFAQSSAFLINQQPEAANESPSLLESPHRVPERVGDLSRSPGHRPSVASTTDARGDDSRSPPEKRRCCSGNARKSYYSGIL